MTKYKLLTLSSLVALTPLATAIACSKDEGSNASDVDKYIESIYTLFGKQANSTIELTSTKTQKAIDNSYFNDPTRCHLTLGETFGIASIKDLPKPSGWDSAYTMTKVQRHLVADAGKSLATYTVKYSITKGSEKKEITFVVNSSDLVLNDANSLANYNARKQFTDRYKELTIITESTKTAQSFRNNVNLNVEYTTAGQFPNSMYGLAGLPAGPTVSGYSGFVKFTKLTENDSVLNKAKNMLDAEIIIKKGTEVVDSYMTQITSKNNYVNYSEAGAINEVLREYKTMMSPDFTTPHEGANVDVFKTKTYEVDIAVPTSIEYNTIATNLNLNSPKKTSDLDLLGTTITIGATTAQVTDRLGIPWNSLKVTNTISKGSATPAVYVFYVVPNEYFNYQQTTIDVWEVKNALIANIGPAGPLTSSMTTTQWEAVHALTTPTTFTIDVLNHLGVTGKTMPSDTKGTTINYTIAKNATTITLNINVMKGSNQDLASDNVIYTIAKPV